MRRQSKLGTLPNKSNLQSDDGDRANLATAMAQRYGSSLAVHENLRNYRERLNLRKKQVAEIMEVTTRTYYAYEAGTRTVPSDCLTRLAILTGGDLNEIMLGRPAAPDDEVIEKTISDFIKVMNFLEIEYADMDIRTKLDIARLVVSTDWHGLPRTHPDMIRDAVRLVTGYRFHPEDHSPPLSEFDG